jgi:hypothetical protein
MGSDIKSNFFSRILIKFFNKIIWSAVIVKSQKMKKEIGILDAYVLPNGVDFMKFKPIERNEAKSVLNLNDKKHILFFTNPR